MAIESQLDLVSAILIFFAAIIPAYLSLKIKGNIRILTITLAAFILLHGVYHVVRMQGLESMADGLFEPASAVALIGFGITFLATSNRRKRQQQQESAE